MASPKKAKSPKRTVKGSAHHAERTPGSAASPRRTARPKRAVKAAAAAAGAAAGAQTAPTLEDFVLAWEEPATMVDCLGEIVIETR